MPRIDPDLIPSVAPGSLFVTLTEDESLNIRWITKRDPVFFEVANRPVADVVVRQLILAKTLDAINLRLSHQSVFPFLIPALVDTGTTQIELPASWIWDLHASVPKKWEKLRLIKIKRISGSNGSSAGEFTGKVRLIFGAVEEGSTTLASLFYQDYEIDSVLSFQEGLRLIPVDKTEEANGLDAGELETITGFIIFLTLDIEDEDVQNFFTGLPPPIGGTDTDSDGIFDSPSEFEIVDTIAGGAAVTDDFSLEARDHGTGTLVASAWNAIPSLDSDINTWLAAFNFPFRSDASRTSTSPISIQIPSPMFKEFDICAPCGDKPTGDTTNEFSPVWIARIERCDDTAFALKFFFATLNVEIGGSSSTPVEFAQLTLERDMIPGQVEEIVTIDDLLNKTGAGDENFQQQFGTGHVSLSSIWGGTTDVIDAFFDAFLTVLDDPPNVIFTQSATILGAPGAVSRSPSTVPTIGQHLALQGTTARLAAPKHPGDDNRFVLEQDCGLGDTIDFNEVDGIDPNPAIESVAFTGALLVPTVYLFIDASSDDLDYNTDILPRLRVLLGRDPKAGDIWFDGTRFKRFVPQGQWVG